ncbi:MAG: phosphatidate cytidylyltransferase [Candidatus Protistobacter heckmanni]|nr:phosphatidate cytidylyltransferase [Candidatus Protistobacter heckmanni]
MLRTRAITALLLLAVLLPIVFLAPPLWLGWFFALAVALAAWEWARLLGISGATAVGYGALALLVLAGCQAFAKGPGQSISQPAWIASAAFWAVYVPWMLFNGVRKFRLPEQAGLLIAGLLILPACWLALMAARERGIAYMLSLLVLVWAADVGAYFAGKAFGRRKLAERISPGKTVEGAIGGLLLALGASAAAAASGLVEPTFFGAALARHGWVWACAVLVLLVAASIAGDLFESLLKRQAGVKDSSGLLPGHGGVLDRIDALLPVLPLAMLLN